MHTYFVLIGAAVLLGCAFSRFVRQFAIALAIAGFAVTASLAAAGVIDIPPSLSDLYRYFPLPR